MAPTTKRTKTAITTMGIKANTIDTISDTIGMMMKLPAESSTTNIMPAMMSSKKFILILPGLSEHIQEE